MPAPTAMIQKMVISHPTILLRVLSTSPKVCMGIPLPEVPESIQGSFAGFAAIGLCTFPDGQWLASALLVGSVLKKIERRLNSMKMESDFLYTVILKN